MVSYTTYAKMVRMTGTALDQTTVEEFITDSEVDVEGMVRAQDQVPSSSSGLLANAVQCLTHIRIINRERSDETRPSSMSIPGKSVSDNLDNQIRMLQDKAQSLVDSFVVVTKGSPYTQTTAAVQEPVVHTDHEMPSMNLDQSKVPEYHDQASDTGNQDSDAGS